MTALGWLMLALGALAGGLVGFVVGRLLAASAAADAAALRIARIDAKADADAAAIDAGLEADRKKAPGLSGAALEEVLNDELDPDKTPVPGAPLPARHPLRGPGK